MTRPPPPPPSARAASDPVADQFKSRSVRNDDLAAIDALHDRVFGPGALTRAAYRVREGQPPFTPYCRVVHDGERLVSALRFTAVCIGKTPGVLMLGPLAVAPEYANQGYGRRLVAEAIVIAKDRGEAAIILVGDLAYYGRFGFAVAPRGQICMPGPVDPARLLLLDLLPAVAKSLRGAVTGAL